MGIEVGKHYLMRDGGVAYIDYSAATEDVMDYQTIKYPVVGAGIEVDVIDTSGNEIVITHHTWTLDGWFTSVGSESVRDLVEELATDDPRVLEFKALCALEGYSHEN